MGEYRMHVWSTGIQGTKPTSIRKSFTKYINLSTYKNACDVFLAVYRWLITQSVDITLAHFLLFWHVRKCQKYKRHAQLAFMTKLQAEWIRRPLKWATVTSLSHRNSYFVRRAQRLTCMTRMKEYKQPQHLRPVTLIADICLGRRRGNRLEAHSTHYCSGKRACMCFKANDDNDKAPQ
jgi:hypothetical protein